MRAIYFLFPVLLCAASCAKTPPATPPPPDLAVAVGGRWVESLARDEMDDSVQAMVTISADTDLALYDGTKVLPRFTFGCDGETFKMELSTGVPLDGADSDESRPEIKVRYDDREALTEKWIPAQNGTALYKPIFYKVQLNDFFHAQAMRLQFKPLKAPITIARFDIRGLATHAKFLGQCKKRGTKAASK